MSTDISRRYSSAGKNVKGHFNDQRYIDFSASMSGFCQKSEKMSSGTIPQNKFFWSENRYFHHHFCSNRRKDRKCNFEMSESVFFLTLSLCFGINKIDSSDVLSCPSRFASSSTARAFTKTTINKDVLNSVSKQKLLSWVKVNQSN